MPRARRCSECGESLAGKASQAKTCGPTCRGKRSRRLKRANDQRAESNRMPEHQKEVTEIVRGERDDVAHRIVEDELRPVVREAITEDVLRGIQDLVGLTPTAVAAISEDLASEDATIRQRAYALVMKYTLGNASVAPTDENTDRQMVVHFNLPRPDSPAPAGEVIESEGDELKVCDLCGVDKPAHEFVDGSDRCRPCWEDQQRKVRERFGD